MDLNELKEKINAFFEKLPFKALAEKIPAETRAKVPVLDKVIPFANQIVCGLAVVLVVTVIAASGGGGGKSGSKSGGGSGSKTIIKSNSASDFKYELNEAGDGVVILDYLPRRVEGQQHHIVIPAKIEGYPVVSFGKPERSENQHGFVVGERWTSFFPYDPDIGRALYMPDITSVIIPDTVTYIGEAFSYSRYLKQITLPKDLKAIGWSAFEKSGITSIIIPEGVKIIASFAFMDCHSLTSVTLPESLEEIGENAFRNCTELTTVKLPSHPITYIATTIDPYDSRINGNTLRTTPSIREGQIDIIFEKTDNDAFKDCPKLSLATRKAITDSGYTGEF